MNQPQSPQQQGGWSQHNTDSLYGSAASDPNFGDAPWANQLHDANAPRGMVITVAAAKGGAGKSTLTLWIAQTLHQYGRKVAIVDANIGQADLSKMLGLQVYQQSVGLPHLLASASGARFTDEQLAEACTHIPEIGTLLAGPKDPMENDLGQCQAALNLAINRLATTHEFVLVDSPVATVYESIFNSLLLSPGGTGKAPLTDLVCLVLNPHNTTAHDTIAYLRSLTASIALGGSDYPADQVVAVLNKSDPTSALDMDYMRGAMAKMQVELVSEIPQINTVIEASNQGRWECPIAAQPGVELFVNKVLNVGSKPPPEPATSKNKGVLGKLRRKKRAQK